MKKFWWIFKRKSEEEIAIPEIIHKGLGKDYGLVFVNNHSDKISVTMDDKNKFIDLVYNPYFGDYHKLFFDDKANKLYYTKENCLYIWPKILIKNFKTKTMGICKHNGEILVTLHDTGKIVNIGGDIKYSDLKNPIGVINFRNELYHTEEELGRDGLIKTPDKVIKHIGVWTNGLCCLEDKLYFGGGDKIIYRYDGKNVEEICDVNFPIWCIYGVKEQEESILYCGGYDKYGIEIINLTNPEKRKTVLEDKAHQVCSISKIPIEFYEEMVKKITVLNTNKL